MTSDFWWGLALGPIVFYFGIGIVLKIYFEVRGLVNDMYYLILGNPKVFSYESLEKLQAALNAKVKVGEEMGIKLIEGEELSVEPVYEEQTVVQQVAKLKIRGSNNA